MKRIFNGYSVRITNKLKRHTNLVQTNKLKANRHRAGYETYFGKIGKVSKIYATILVPLPRPLKLPVHPFADLNQTADRHESKKHLSLSIFRPWPWAMTVDVTILSSAVELTDGNILWGVGSFSNVDKLLSKHEKKNKQQKPLTTLVRIQNHINVNQTLFYFFELSFRNHFIYS